YSRHRRRAKTGNGLSGAPEAHQGQPPSNPVSAGRMTAAPPQPLPSRSKYMNPNPSRFLFKFMLLSVLSGITIGMGRVVTTLYALHIGADSLEVGLIASIEALGRLLMTLPAGFLVAAYGVQRIYFLSSLGPMLLSLAIPWMQSWTGVALMRGLISLCIPFRVVSMNSSFLLQLPRIGTSKAGWYRAAQ